MIDVVFPLLFGETTKSTTWYVTWIQGRLGSIGRDQLLLISCLWIPVIFAIRGAAGYANAYLVQYSGMRVIEEIRTDLFVKLQSLPIGFFKRNQSGDLLARVMSDTQMLRQIVTQSANDLIRQPATLVAAFSFLLLKAWGERSFFIALIALITVPVCVIVIRRAGKKLAYRARALQRQGGDLTSTLTESLQAPLEIRAYNLQERQIHNFRGRIREMLRTSMKVVKYRQAISPSIEVVSAAGFAFALYLGVREGMSQSDFVALGVALFMCYEPIKKLGAIHSHFKQADASIDRINGILDSDEALVDPLHPEPFGKPHEALRFEQVTFAYQAEPVLKDIDVRIPIGQCVALIGPSGAGKSTFAHLVPRFYDVGSGAITLDGVDVRAVKKSDLRNAIGIVPQMPALFSGTIEENIRIGRSDATSEEVHEAASKASAHEFISSLPEGYQTRVGERGDLLSGGQRQRIAIARAFLKDAPILILDEATSALDSESEAMIQNALARLIEGRTTLVIAHRFSTIRIADRILVFQNGRIVADGSHDELLQAREPTYLSMMGGLLES